MTFLELRTLVRSWLDDVNGGYFTDAQVNVFLNNGQREVQKLVEQAFESHFMKCSTTTTVNGQREYQLPDDFKRVARLEIIMGGSGFSNESVNVIQKITRNQQDMISSERIGTPIAYYFHNNQLILVPAPDSAKTLRLTYIYRIPDMVGDSDVSLIPEDYHQMIAIEAAMDGLIKDGRDVTALMAKKSKFEENLKRDAEQRHIDTARTVVQNFDDDIEGYF